ncbi:GBS Bsp-like repeat-containing protein [Streptococcus moroccensis]|uniref:Uncharacterized protein YegP (UPF0339 family) n=1 Tax=Streptococcus moroccensis TaxID=1451356 RepID=A0ABT9YR26_9STRE|nr:GBS Bsp-like repeat-containing protein [Streptococcus moroccensis]MDQ0222184.1 uncharacterized protein YegP (UPF0339 family) [Streptococcus moroccensis]
MKRYSKFIILSSTVILGALTPLNAVNADQISGQAIYVKTKETTSVNQRVTAKIQALEVEGKPVLRLTDLSTADINQIKVTVSSKSNESLQHTYEAKLDKDGYYTVELDAEKHDFTDNSFVAKVVLERHNNVFDFLSDYDFTWEKEQTTEKPTANVSNEAVETVANTEGVTTATETSRAIAADIVSESAQEKTDQPAETTATVETVTDATTTAEPNPQTSEASKETNTEVEQESSTTTESASKTDALSKTRLENPSVRVSLDGKDVTSTPSVSQSTSEATTSKETDSKGSTEKSTDTDTNNSTTPRITEEVSHFGTEAIARNATAGVQTTGTIKVVKNEDNGSFEIIVSNADTENGVEEVLLPVWSAKNGQDDIEWYRAQKQSDDTFKAIVSISNHNNDLGEYYIHLYYIDRKKKLVGVGGTQTNISKTVAEPTGTLKVSKNNTVTGEFELTVSNIYAPQGLREVLVPVWSDANGQDDIKWYSAQKHADGSYRVTVNPANHKQNTGVYHAHLYYRQNDGQLKGVSGIKHTVQNAPVSGNISIKNSNNASGQFEILVTNVASQSGIKDVLVPVWGDKDGQNDIKWYTATKQSDGNYKVLVDIKNHNYEQGTYHAHLYYRLSNGSLKGVSTATTVVETKNSFGTLSIVNKNNQTGSFDVVIKDVNPSYVLSEILLPIWSEKNDQDDIQWYKATKQNDGTYKVSVSISNHKFDSGTYHVHYYHRLANGELKGIGSIKTSIESQNSSPTGNLAISKKSNGFEVLISNVNAPSGVTSVLVPIWSDAGGQDDIRWYNAAKQSDGNYHVSVNIADHHNRYGKYHAHLYYRLGSGQLVGVSGTSTEVASNNTTNNASITTSYNGTGSYTVNLSNVSGYGRVNVAVWSEVGDQDDIRWYEAYSNGNGNYSFNFNAQNHSGTGTYHIHAYLTNNGNTLLGSTTVNVARTNYSAPYYYQGDTRWGSRMFGAYTMYATGCVPTVVAMAASGITGNAVSPVDVASYLYYNTQEFNRIHGMGTTGQGVVLGANHFGVKTKALGSQNAIVEALQNGHYVAAAVGHSVFVSSPSTHQILLKGYQNGKTYVMDPYTPSLNGWYDVSYLTSVPSTWSGDFYNGSVFIQLSE